MLKKPTLIAVLLLATQTAFASAISTTESPAKGQWSTGVEYNHVFDQALDSDSSSYTAVNIDSANQVSAVVSYGVYGTENVTADVFGKLGVSEMTIASTPARGGNEEVNADWGFLWNIGGKISRHFENNVSAMAHVQYTRWKSEPEDGSYNGTDFTLNSGTQKMRVSDFQFAVLFSRAYRSSNAGFSAAPLIWKPYIGPLFNWTKLHNESISYPGSSAAALGGESEDNVGVAIGVDILNVTETLKLNLEIRFITEEALTLAVHYLF